jgi:PIN domain nuclease of toxin-antitoxin system
VAQVTSPILVDTHFILWLRVAPRQLTRGERAVLDNAPSRHVSIVSLWEIAIMVTVGRIPPDDHLLETPVGFDLLPVRETHCKAYAALPMHHRDPFDRMLIAQAQSEQVPLLTRDRRMTAYAEQATILRYPEP